MNEAEFRQAERDWYSRVEKITEQLTDIDDTIPELPVKDVVSTGIMVQQIHSADRSIRRPDLSNLQRRAVSSYKFQTILALH